MSGVKNTAIKRIKADIREMMTDPSDQYQAEPTEDNMFDWHFTIRGPPDTDFEGGVYHGRIILSPDYPFKPPNIIFLTPNGRFQVKEKICLSISSYHPEHWQPAWGVRLILEALISFMPSDGDGAVGALYYSSEERKRLAILSTSWNCSTCGKASDLLPELKEIRETGPSKYADQIAQLHIHGLEKKQNSSNEQTSMAENSEPSPSVPSSNEVEATIPVQENSVSNSPQADLAHPQPQSQAPPQNPSPNHNTTARSTLAVNRTSAPKDIVDDALYYISIALGVAIFALLYRKLLILSGVMIQ